MISTAYAANRHWGLAVKFQNPLSIATPIRWTGIHVTSFRALTLKLPDLGAFDSDRMAVVPESLEQGVDHERVAQEIGPFLVGKVGGNNGRPVAITFFDELEKDIGLLGFYIQIS
jgi:hypothetical protein